MEQAEEKKVFYKKLNEDHQSKILKWWHDLNQRNGPRAELRRCFSPEDAALHPDTIRLKNIIGWISFEAAAAISGILSHIRTEQNVNFNKSFAATLGNAPDGKVKFSETRFRQLLSSRNWDEFYTRLRRAVKIFNGNVNPLSVADMIIRWDEEQRYGTKEIHGRSLKFDMANDYYIQYEKTN